MDFFERLYLGFEAEYYVMACLFGAGYEAFKMPADFGFDLLVTNQKERSLKRRMKRRDIQPPYVLQVKSRRISEEEFEPGPNGRSQVRVSFPIKKQDIKLIIYQDNAYLVCVVFLSSDSEIINNNIIHFWLHSSHVREIYDLGCFRNYQNQKDVNSLEFCLRFYPQIDTEDFLEYQLLYHNHLTEEGKQILLEYLPPTLPRNWNATEYISLVIPPGNQNRQKRIKQISPELTDFQRLGMEVEMLRDNANMRDR